MPLRVYLTREEYLKSVRVSGEWGASVAVSAVNMIVCMLSLRKQSFKFKERRVHQEKKTILTYSMNDLLS